MTGPWDYPPEVDQGYAIRHQGRYFRGPAWTESPRYALLYVSIDLARTDRRKLRLETEADIVPVTRTIYVVVGDPVKSEDVIQMETGR